jgi:hypothetical protein
MTLRPAPGAQIAAGRLRVDATKAIAKLREYQLVDRTAWILEAIRAAVAAGATTIDLQGDSNDVWLSWAGTPWPAEDLPRLFDELVSPEPGASRHHVRLLAAAVNSALGANPAYVDVYAVSEGGALRARYTPDVLETPASDLAESPLQKVQAQPAAIPQGAPVGMHVHFRRRASLEVVSFWLLRADPPELVMARSACSDIATPIQIGDTLFDRKTSTRDVVRVPLGEDLDGWIAVTDTTHVRPSMNDVELWLAERGVLLEQTSIGLGLAALRPPPLRVVIDADRLPTNASRSEVRRDAHPVSTGERRAVERLPELLAQLTAMCSLPDPDPRARHAAIHLLASVIGGEDWALRAREIEPPLRALAELPLVRDAAGVPRPVCWNWSGLVHAGSTPLPQDLAPWLVHVLWAPPDEPTSALPRSWIDKDALSRYLRTAKQARRAEKKFYDHQPREPRVLDRKKPRVRARLGAPVPASCIPDAMFEDVTGEVCVYTEQRGSELVVLLQGREIETVEFDSGLPFAAVIDSPRVTPTDRYRGVARDAGYAHVEQGMRAGVVRAMEAVALAHDQKFVDGYHVALGGTEESDASLIRSALYLSRNLGVQVTAPFEHARIWRTTSGYCSIAELRTHVAIGVVRPQSRVVPLADRLVVYAQDHDHALLAELVASHFVPYETTLLDGPRAPNELATQVMGTEPHALGIEDEGLVVAILPAETARVLVHHRGKLLVEWKREPTLAPCTIAIDCDRVVPTADWTGVVDDAGLVTRDYAPYERALAREVVKALLGERSLELLGGDRVELGGTLGRWLCHALVLASPVEVLGEELLKQLELASLFHVLGDPRRLSIAELAVMFPETIVFVDHATEAVAGFPVLVAEHIVVRTVARLAKRKFRQGSEELAKKRTQIAHELRLGMHRAKPTVPFEVAGTHVRISSTHGKGVIGCGRDTLEIQVLVEGRLFQTITRPQEPPLACVFELTDLSAVDDRFEALRSGKEDTLVAVVRAHCTELVRAIAETFPESLADAGPRRTLLATYARKYPLATDLREALLRAVEFPTVQGGRAKALAARRGSAICVTSWTGEWLAPEGTPDELDGPILLVAGSPELAVVLSALGNTTDVTRDVARLQTQRRIARGLLPSPKCIGAMPELTRRIADLATTALGPGEIALVAGESEVLVHAGGELRERVALACLPSIQLAIEGADLVGEPAAVEKRVGREARQLAVLLVQRVLAQNEPRTLPPEIRRNLRRAILAGSLAALHDAPVFETITGAWIDLAAVQAQRELFGDLWCVPAVPEGDERPLDERRIVLVLSLRDQGLANEHGIPAVDAAQELRWDAQARKNQARPLAESLALDVPGVISKIELTGDGITAPRGFVGVLAPDAAKHRQAWFHRAMHPFPLAKDPCRWPTIAKLDDARLVPDRSWDHPERDDAYKSVIDALHRASNDALRAVAPPPANALASIRVAPWTYDSITLLRAGDIQLRGTLWLAGPPIPAIAPTIRIVEANDESTFVPLRGLGLAGTIYVHTTKRWEREAILETLCKTLHAKLVCELTLTHRRSPDLVTAHLAWALALERIKPEDTRDALFTCFRPSPIDGAALATILGSGSPVVVVGPQSTYPDHAFVDDGSETARIIRNWLGSRLRPPSTRARPDTVEPPPPPASKPAFEHPLQPFVNRLHTRIVTLGIQVAQWRIVDDRDEPIARYEHDTLELAANNRHVLETAAACVANTAWSADALDALAAHCVTVLNVALASITDTTEARAINKLLG